MIIKSYAKDYEVVFKADISFIKDIYKNDNNFFIIDEKVFELYKNELFEQLNTERIFLISATEENKTIDMALRLCEEFSKRGIKRNSTIVSIGGGIVQDITGFAANIYNRGIGWIFIPTTLLAMCDSCIGGKTSLNFKDYKNILGTFYAPDKIYICNRFIRTLSEEDYCSGLGEIIKFNILLGESAINDLEKRMKELLQRNEDILTKFILQSLQLKQRYIEKDEFDRKERLLLNFAHTFGHAFESVSEYNIPHGQAVALGILVANRISCNRRFINGDLVNRIDNLCLKVINVPLHKAWFEIEKIIKSIQKDKKQTNEGLTGVLLNGEYKLEIFKDLSKKEVEEAVGEIIDMLSFKNMIRSA